MGLSQSRELQLKTFVANNGASLTLTVSEDAELEDLRSLLRLQDPEFFRRGAGEIEIYTAKKPDGSWLKVTEKQRRQIKLGGRVPHEIFKMLDAENSVLLCKKMSEYEFPPADQMETDAYHLLVERLGDVRVIGEPTWKEQPPARPILLEGLVYRVPRAIAVKELQGIHLANFNQFHDPSQPRKWVIPEADHVSGMGKTVLASYYIRWCREMWPEVSTRSAFQHELCACHTVYMSAPSRSLLGGRITVDLVKTSLVEAINDKLEPDTELELADLMSKDLGSLTKHLVKTLGPLFIVLDKMDTWFYGVEAAQAYRLFLQFCEDFVSVWLAIPGVYVIVLGYSDLLQCVDEQAMATDDQSACAFKRLRLYLFRPKDIEEILRKTQVRSGSIETLRQRWGLATDEDVTEAARLLFERSAGFLRVICQNVRAYRTFADLKKDTFPELSYRAQKELHHELRKHQTLLREWLVDGKLVNLRESIDVGTRKRVWLWKIALRCRLGWEGTLEEAKLVALPEVKREILNLIYPLNDYVRAMAGTLECVTPDLAEVLKWMCVKRWRELFATPSVRMERLPAFFKKNSVLGEYPAVYFSEAIGMLPQILPDTGASFSSLLNAPIIDAKAANVDDWPRMMQEIRRLLDDREDESLSFKFRPRSKSIDAFFVTRNRSEMHVSGDSKKLPRTSYWKTHTMTVGLVVREVKAATRCIDSLHVDCKRFDAMFKKLDNETRTAFGAMTNVLVVAVTGRSDEWENLDKELKLGAGCEHISDVVMLDLTTSKKRAEFFGFEDSEEEDQLLIRTMEKIVDQADLQG